MGGTFDPSMLAGAGAAAGQDEEAEGDEEEVEVDLLGAASEGALCLMTCWQAFCAARVTNALSVCAALLLCVDQTVRGHCLINITV